MSRARRALIVRLLTGSAVVVAGCAASTRSTIRSSATASVVAPPTVASSESPSPRPANIVAEHALTPPLDSDGERSTAPMRAAFTRSVNMRSAPSSAPVVVHLPQNFDPSRPIRVVVFLHGLYSCALQEITSEPVQCRIWHGAGRLGEFQDSAGANTILVGPQFATGCPPGRFGTRDGFRDFLDELLSETLLDVFGGARTISDVESITLLVSSGGFRPAEAILARGGVGEQIRVVALLDALYGSPGAYLQWVADQPRGASRRLFVAHTTAGTPARTIDQFIASARRRLAGDVETNPVSLEDALRTHRVVIVAAHAAHNVLAQTYVQAILRGTLGAE